MLKSTLLLLTLFTHLTLYAKSEEYLITMPGPNPALAKTIKKTAGSVTLSLDPQKKIKKGNKEFAVTFEMVKTEVEKRLKKFKAQVTGNDSALVIAYTGDENDFLTKLSKTKIRPPAADSSVAVASSVSDGGVRARTAVREPKDDEIKGTVVRLGPPVAVMVTTVGKNWNGKISKSLIQLQPHKFKFEKGQILYFQPVNKDAKSQWSAKNFTTK